MSAFFKKRYAKREKAIEEQVERWNGSLENDKIRISLEDNQAVMQGLFTDVDLIRYKKIQGDSSQSASYLLVFCDGLVNNEIINANIVRPLMNFVSGKADLPQGTLVGDIVHVGEVKKTNSFRCIIEQVMYGDSILFAQGSEYALVMNTKNFKLRAIGEPDNEKTLVGPREGFNESLSSNLSQVLRRLRTHELKTKMMTLGTRTKTAICVSYLDSLVKPEILEELFCRLNKIDIDGVLDANYITELIRDHPYSPFRSTGYTERPDVVVSKLLEGRIAVFVDGSPMVLTVPYLFDENFQSAEDYYLNFYYTSFARMLRTAAFYLTIVVPGFYVAIVAFHQEMLPLQFLMRIATERRNVPLPAAVEAVAIDRKSVV